MRTVMVKQICKAPDQWVPLLIAPWCARLRRMPQQQAHKSGRVDRPGGQTSTFTTPTGSVQVTLEECKDDPQYFELAADKRVTLKCELTTDGDCCEVADIAPRLQGGAR